MIYCGLDTETTGLINYKVKATDPEQARVIQLALKLFTSEGRVISQFSTLIQPSGWHQIHPKAFEAHGITREDCEQFGIPAAVAYGIFCHYASHADMFVAHNANFDKGMMKIESNALEIDFPTPAWHCTMVEATPICKVPPTEAMQRAGRHHFKNANLGEALKILCGKELIGAHDAMNDVNGCVDVFLELKKRKAA